MNTLKIAELGYEELCDGVYLCTQPRHSLLELPKIVGAQVLPHDNEGTIVWDIKPDNTQEGDVARSHTTHEFAMHTDASFDVRPPRYIALEVIHGDRFGGGSQTFLPLSQILLQLSGADKASLATEYTWSIPPEFSTNGQTTNKLPILFGEDDDPFIRYREDCVNLDVASTEQKAAFYGLKTAIERMNPVTHAPRIGEQMIIDNWRALHARTEIRDAVRHITRLRLT